MCRPTDPMLGRFMPVKQLIKLKWRKLLLQQLAVTYESIQF